MTGEKDKVNGVVAADAEKLLNAMYDAMIAWNITGSYKPLRLYLNMTPQDYLGFMKDPESWATSYISKLYASRSCAQKE